jgi:TPR repeat protein
MIKTQSIPFLTVYHFLDRLGLKQDFPLAKRHYDLAAATNSAEADLAVTLALWAMHLHERVVKFQMWWQERRKEVSPTPTSQETPSQIPQRVEIPGHPLPPAPVGAPKKTKTEVIMSHVFSWESLVIIILTLILTKLLQHRRTRR